MKILHVAPSIESAYGGPTQSLAGYIAASVTAGHEVDVTAPETAHEDVDRLTAAGANRVEMFPGYGKGSTASSPALVNWLRRASHGYDVIHVHGLFNFISTFAARTAIVAGSPVVIRPFGTLSRYTFSHRRSMLKRPWFQRLERPNIMRAAGIHFTTTTERDEAEWNDLRLGDRAHVVPPPFITDNSPPVREDSGVPTVLFLGRLHPVKNLPMLIEAWASVIADIPEARLEIAGAGNARYSQALREQVEKRKLGKSVTFRGFLSGAAKQSALAAASLLVLPSHHENFGMVVIESIAAGVPVVVSPHVQLQDFVAGSNLGIVCGESAGSLAESIRTALTDRDLAERVANKGKEIVSRTFAPEVIGKKLSTMYLAAVNSHRDRLSGN